MRRRLVAGNWKMNASISMIEEIASQLRSQDFDCDVLLCPPFPFLMPLADQLKNCDIGVGAQDCSTEISGAYTGEVAAPMLHELGCEAVIVGHSERRSYHSETDEQILAKTRQALASGLKVLLCVGETLEERKADQAEAVVERQLALAISELSDSDWDNVVVAYEPVWAIGTGETATPEQAQEIHGFIRSLLAQRSESISSKTRVLYGGSVKAANAAELFSQPDIDGALVGGASLDASQFSSICKA